jgi:FkbM family methyltransferase
MKPSFWTSPLAWTKRKLRLKVGDAVQLMGYKPVKKIDFSNMAGEEFAHVIDVGVADGTPDLYARFPNAYLDLFEPHPYYQEHITKTLLQKREGRLHRMGLGSTDGTAQLYLKGRTGSTLASDRGRGQIEVPVRRLDSVLRPADIRRPCLLKIDTEGYELEVLRGSAGIMSHIDCVVSEVHFATPELYRPRDLFGHLDALGFEMSEMLDFHSGQGRVWCADFVFRRIAGRKPVTAQP